jgi:hypothetical protein
MAKEINLLNEQSEESGAEKKLKQRINILSPIILLIYAVLVIGIFSYSLLQTAQASDLKKKIKNTENSIQQMSETESFLRGSKIKLAAVNTVLAQNVDYAQTIARLKEITPEELNLTAMILGGDRSVEVSYRVLNSDLVAGLINNLLNPQIGGKYFEKVKLKNLAFSKDGFYIISLTFAAK